MAQTRLTKSMRESIASKASFAASKVKSDTLHAQRNKIGIEIFHQLIGGEALKGLKALPPRFTCTQTYFNLGYIDDSISKPTCINGYGVEYNRSIEVQFGDYILGFSDRCKHTIMYGLILAESPILAEYLRLSAELHSLVSDTFSAGEKIFSLLSSIKTVEEAIKVWPEGEEFLNTHITAIPVNLPATRAKDVNDALATLAA